MMIMIMIRIMIMIMVIMMIREQFFNIFVDQMQERRDRVESDLRKEAENLTMRLEHLKQGHSAESEMYR